jgi:hypothetical protein
VLTKNVLSFQEIRNDVTKKGETLSWLKSRLKILIEVSSESEAQKQGDELADLSSCFKAMVTLLSEVFIHLHSQKTVLAWESGGLSFGCSLASHLMKKLKLKQNSYHTYLDEGC